MLSVCLTKSWPLDKAGKATELEMRYSSFGVTGGFLPSRLPVLIFKKRGKSYNSQVGCISDEIKSYILRIKMHFEQMIRKG